MPGCVVPGCEFYELAQSIGVPFHQFPRDATIRRAWLVKIRNDALPVNASFDRVKNLRVCGKHFTPSDYERDLRHELTGSKRRNILKKGAIPSVFSFNTDPPRPERSAFTKREEIRRQQTPSFAFGSARQQEEVQPSTSGLAALPEYSTDTEEVVFSSPFKESTPSKLSSPFKPSSTEEDSGEQTTTTTESEGEAQVETGKFIVMENKLDELFKRCQRCGEGIISKKRWSVGAKLVIAWECVRGHEGRWQSSDDVRGMPAINLFLASSIVLSGNTYQGVKNLAEILNLQMFGKTAFNAIQNTYILPVIDNAYSRQYHKNMALMMTRSMDGGEISLLGDGRSDSPGYSAKYTTYSVMEESTQNIVEMQLVQVTETSSSVAMEKEGFVRCMDSILHHGVNVQTFTTDRSPSIRKLMKDDYSSTNHQFDCWHVCKSVKKKCSASGRKKGHDIMQKWIKSITNHLWYCCSACNGDAEELKRLWHSILHHVVGVHQWEDEDGTKRSCNHPPLSPEEQEIKIWFDPTSTVYRDLTSIVMDRRLSNDLEQLALFKHTSGLEVYHSLMLKFAPKRTHFHYPAMKGRMQLAVLDHNHNTGRQVATTHTGKEVYRYVSSKQMGGEWTAKRVLEKKSHGYATDMLTEIKERREDESVVYADKESFVRQKELPKNIAKERRPPVKELLAKKLKK